MSEADGCDGALWGIVVKETKEEVLRREEVSKREVRLEAEVRK